MRFTTHKDLNKEVTKLVRDEGWTFEQKGLKHGKLHPPNHPNVNLIVSSSPSDSNVLSVFRREVRNWKKRLGLI